MEKKEKKVRIKDIAEMLSISIATVSLAINNKPGVSDEVREKVLRTCRENGYALAKWSPAVSSKTIELCIYKKSGLVLSDTPFFSELLESISQEAKRNNYGVSYCYYAEAVEPYTAFEKIVSNQEVAGIIILATEMQKEDMRAMQMCSCPYVILDAYFPWIKADTILINNEEGAYEMVEYLIGCGHKEIGHLKSKVQIINFAEREEGYHRAMTEHKFACRKEYEFSVGPTFESAYRDMKAYLSEGRKLPTAFMADNDAIAMGTMKAMQEAGISIPEQVSVMGFDDVRNSRLVEPMLTTVRVRKNSMGKMATSSLINRINEPSDEYVIFRIGTDIVVRDSVSKIN